MLNATGVLTVMDRGLTLNWEDGPTLHRLTAQVHYHTAASPTVQVVRVSATTSHDETDDESLRKYTHVDKAISAIWAWREYTRPAHNGTGLSGDDYSLPVYAWAAQLAVTNVSDEAIYLDTLDVLRIERAYLGQFNLGAPPGLWRCTQEPGPSPARASIAWDTWSPTPANTSTYIRSREMLTQPTVSNRSRPPALLIRADNLLTILPTPPPDSDEQKPVTPPVSATRQNAAVLPTEIKLEMNGSRFDRFLARSIANGTLLTPQAICVSSTFCIASGDDAAELRELTIG